MSYIIHVKKNNSVYAYSVESYRDPVTKKVRQNRTYLGRLSDTGEIIPKKETRHAKKKALNQIAPNSSQDINESQNKALTDLSFQIEKLQIQQKAVIEALKTIADTISSIKVDID